MYMGDDPDFKMGDDPNCWCLCLGSVGPHLKSEEATVFALLLGRAC
jgi:hypothetical protein